VNGALPAPTTHDGRLRERVARGLAQTRERKEAGAMKQAQPQAIGPEVSASAQREHEPARQDHGSDGERDAEDPPVAPGPL
jgi:hypothetical protein